MTTENHPVHDLSLLPDAKGMRFGIVVSKWNGDITAALEKGAVETLIRAGVAEKEIEIIRVPGSFELPLGGQLLASTGRVDAVILLGCVIKGETRHFDYVCLGVTQGTMELNLKYNIPFIFGVLTTGNRIQAQERAGGRLGNKGTEAALAAIEMAALKRSI